MFAVALAVGACLALLAPATAGAANVVNGDFETGTLQGWSVHRSLEAGNWLAYKGTDEPYVNNRSPAPPAPQVDPPQVPPQGTYAAVADEINPDTLILYQDVALPAGQSETLSLLVYYNSSVPIAVPGSGTLSVESEVLEGQKNQQYRIDVMRPEAPLDSVDSNDILRAVFRTAPGARKTMPPTRLTADLGAFAGQTVRLRFAVAAHEEILTGGVDDVSISAGGKGGSPPPGGKVQISFGKVKLNRAKGTAILPVKVPSAGMLKAKDGAASKKRPQLIKPATAKVAKAGTAKLLLKPTKAALATLKQKHKLRVKVAVSFTPKGGRAVTATLPVVLKLKAPRR
jgi:hypothetical protein